MSNKKRKLYLIGAGELAREIETWISLDDEFMQKWEIAGFLDRDLKALDKYPSDYKIVGVPETFNFQSDDAALMCIANPKIKERIINAVANKVEFITYISNKAIIGKFTKIGNGTVICPNTIVSTNCKIGDFITLNCSCLIGHDSSIGNYSSLMPHTDLGGHVKIGSRNFLGTKTTIIPGKSVHDNIFTAAGSVIMRNIKNEGTYIGNPATLLKY